MWCGHIRHINGNSYIRHGCNLSSPFTPFKEWESPKRERWISLDCNPTQFQTMWSTVQLHWPASGTKCST